MYDANFPPSNFFKAQFLLKNKFEITREPNHIHVKINGNVDVFCAVEGTYPYAAHPLDFVHNGSVVLDVLINSKHADEEDAFEALCNIYDCSPYPDDKRAFCNWLLGNRISNSALTHPVKCKLANGLEIQVTRHEDVLTATTQNGIVLIVRKEANFSLFTYRLANTIHSAASELEQSATYWISSESEYEILQSGVNRRMVQVDLQSINLLAKAIANIEDLPLVMLIGHYNSGKTK
jgi:hypothetical protein